MKLLSYFLEANAYLIVFHLFYKLFLQKETFYNFNRAYLLGCTLLSFLLPLVKIGSLYTVQDLQYVVVASTTTVIENPLEENLMLFYILVASVMLLRLMMRLFQIFKLAKRGEKTEMNGLSLVAIPKLNHAFSFMNRLFVNAELKDIQIILNHERVHIRQWHSLDILLMECLHIINWFNPLFILLKKDLKSLHEFIADEEAAKAEPSVADYALYLIAHTHQIAPQHLGNNMFNQSLLKTRIMKLQQKKSPGIARLKYLGLFLLLPAMLVLSSLSFAKSYSLVDLMPVQQDTIKEKKTPPPPPTPPAAPTKVKGSEIKNIPPPPPPKTPVKEVLEIRLKDTPPPPPPPIETTKKVNGNEIKSIYPQTGETAKKGNEIKSIYPQTVETTKKVNEVVVKGYKSTSPTQESAKKVDEVVVKGYKSTSPSQESAKEVTEIVVKGYKSSKSPQEPTKKAKGVEIKSIPPPPPPAKPVKATKSSTITGTKVENLTRVSKTINSTAPKVDNFRSTSITGKTFSGESVTVLNKTNSIPPPPPPVEPKSGNN